MSRYIVDFHQDAVPGDFVWVFYPGFGFEPHKVEHVTKSTITCNGGRYNYKTGQRIRIPGFIVGGAQKRQMEWLSANRSDLVDIVSKIDDVSVLRKIAKIAGYQERKPIVSRDFCAYQ